MVSNGVLWCPTVSDDFNNHVSNDFVAHMSYTGVNTTLLDKCPTTLLDTFDFVRHMSDGSILLDIFIYLMCLTIPFDTYLTTLLETCNFERHIRRLYWTPATCV